MYDPACEVLARHFLGALASSGLIEELAQHIQDGIEDWIEYQSGGDAEADAMFPAPPSKLEG